MEPSGASAFDANFLSRGVEAIAQAKPAVPISHRFQMHSRSLLNAFIEGAAFHDETNEKEFTASLVRAHDQGAPLPVRPPKMMPMVADLVKEALGFDEVVIPEQSSSLAPTTERIRQARFKFRDYSLSEPELSDGQRERLNQMDLLKSRSLAKILFLVDEPELRLSDATALELWQTVEENYPNAVFLYATHNIGFATRETVHSTYLMKMGGELEKLDLSEPIKASDIQDIVGARLQILRSAKPIIFCKDELSKLLVQDLLPSFQSVQLKGKKSVILAVQGEPIWAQIRSGSQRYCGVIDRDACDTIEISNLARRGIFCLPLYDAESILISPEIAKWSLSKSAGRKVSEAEYADLIVASALEREEITLDKIRDHLCWREKPELRFKRTGAGMTVEIQEPQNLESLARARVNELENAIAGQDVMAILALFYGKFTYRSFVKLARQRLNVQWPENPTQRYRELRSTEGFASMLRQVSWLREFERSVSEHLSAR